MSAPRCRFTQHAETAVWFCECCGAGSRVYTAATQRACPRPCLRGLGDLVALVAEPIARVLHIACGGCRRRRRRWNALLPFGRREPPPLPAV